MPPPPGSSDPDLWVSELPVAKETSAGSMSGCRIIPDGSTEHGRENEDRYYTCKLDMVQLYMVLDGHNGSRACDFAIKRIPSLLLQRNMGDNGERAAEVLRYAFENTEKNFFMMLDPSITRKMGLQMEMQEKTSMVAYQLYPEKVEELQRLEEQISGGTTAVVALILNNHHLWVANVGDSRAVLCYLDGWGKLHAEQISEDHNTKNDKEIARLVQCGLDEVRLRSSGRLGIHQNTRSIGDYGIKGGFKDHDILSTATKEPGTAEPFISHPPLDITTIRGFLLLMSDGLYDAHAAVTNSPHTVNHDIALLVQRHLDHAPNITEVADKVIAEVSANFRSMVQRSGESARMDDITLIIRNLGYPVGQLSGNSFNFSPLQQQQPQSLAGGPKPRYENSQFLQSMPAPTAFSHQSTNSSSAITTSTRPSRSHVDHTTAQPEPSLHASHQVPAMDPYSNPAYHPQQSGHYPPTSQYPPTGQYNRQQGQNEAAGGQGFSRSGSDSRVNHAAPLTNYQDQAVFERQQQNYQGQVYSQHPSEATNHTGQFLPHTSTTSSSHSHPTATTHQAAAVYENWELRNRTSNRHGGGGGGVTELTGGVGAMSMATPSSHPNSSRLSNLGTAAHHQPYGPSSNAEYQFQSPPQASGGPSQTNVASHVGGGARVTTDDSGLGSSGSGSGGGGGGGGGGTTGTNGRMGSDEAGRGGGGLLSKQSTMDDESWMYNDALPSNSTQSTASSGGPSGGPEQEQEGEVGEEKGGKKDNDTSEVGEISLERESETAQPEVKEEEEENGMIKPIIKFDKFPPDLSWDQI